jgi:type III pantothenate kinase
VTPDVVVDIGNSRMKWGRCADGRVVEMVSLTLDEPAAWTIQAATWGLKSPLDWAVASVNPDVAARFHRWAADSGGTVLLINDHRSIPLYLAVDAPEQVGVDRLLNAFAAHCIASPRAAVAVSVGTAVTVDLVDEAGTFRGGVIFPGPRLMAESLHAHTAKLPLVDAATLPTVVAPGKHTAEAILAGIRAAVVGGVALVVTHYAEHAKSPWVFVTGGAAGDLGGFQFGRQFAGTRFVPTLTLDGIRIAAEALP